MSRSRAARHAANRSARHCCLAAAVVSAGAQETVTISVPLAVSFPVTDVSRSTSGTPSVTTVSFSNANLSPGKALRVSVQSDAAVIHAAERIEHSGVERVMEQPWGERGHRMERDAQLLLLCARVPEQPPRSAGNVGSHGSRMDAGGAGEWHSRRQSPVDDPLESGIHNALTDRPNAGADALRVPIRQCVKTPW